MSFSLILSGNSSDFTTVFNSIVLQPPYEYEAALLSIDTYNSIPNIIEGKNNLFKYFNGQDWKVISLQTGAYELDAINNEIKRQMRINGDNADIITISAEISTLRSIINILSAAAAAAAQAAGTAAAAQAEYKVAFEAGTIASLLGFSDGVLNPGYNLSPNIVDIMPINTILVNLDIIQGSYVNGQASPAIYAFYPNVSPGYKIIERPSPSLTYFLLSRHDISRIRVWLTDQDGNMVDFRGERITLRIHIRRHKPRI